VEESSGEGTYVGEETGKRRWVMREKKPIEFSLKSPRCTLNTPHLTSPDWKKNGVQGNKNHKNIFCIRKKGIRFFTKRSNKKSNLVFQQKINAYALKKAKTRGHHRNPSPIAVLTSLSREKKKKTKTQPLNQLPIKPPNHGIAVNNETIQLPGAGKKKEHEKRKLRQTQAITTANATVQAHAASNSTRGGRPAKTKVKAKEGRKTG
jgi:hypothetical protein